MKIARTRHDSFPLFHGAESSFSLYPDECERVTNVLAFQKLMGIVGVRISISDLMKFLVGFWLILSTRGVVELRDF